MQGSGSRRNQLMEIALWAIVGFLFIYLWENTAYTFDVAMYVVAAKKLLAEGGIYVNVADIDPPLIFYVHLLNAKLAEFFSAPHFEFYNFSVLALIVAGSLTIQRLSRGRPGFAYLSLSMAAASLAPLAAFHFGQREHLFMLLFIPYFLLRWASRSERGILFYAYLLGAAATACLKPHFALILVAFEGYLVWRRGREKLTFYLLLSGPGIFYLLAFLLWSPASNQAFWGEVVPTVLANYHTMGLPWGELFRWLWVQIFSYSVLIMIFSLLGWRNRGREGEILLPLALCAALGLAGAIEQGKGWEYHLISCQYPLLFGFPAAFRAIRRQLVSEKLATLACLAVALLTLCQPVRAAYLMRGFFYYSEESCSNKEIMHVASRGDRVAIFSAHPCFSYPMFYRQGYVTGTRYVYMYPLAFFNNNPARKALLLSHYPGPAELGAAELDFIDKIKTDLRRYRPEVIAFPVVPAYMKRIFLPIGFDSLLYAKSTGIWGEIDQGYALAFESEKIKIFKRKNLLKESGPQK